MTTEPDYVYDRIDLATNAIRLVRVLRHKNDPESSIRCEIFQTLLDRELGVPYEALSYTWGDLDIPKVPIDIVSESTGLTSRLLVLPNLHGILRHLRLTNEDRVLWVDAICIDQQYNTTSLRERTHQVGQMRLVYQMADRVIAWLGEIPPARNECPGATMLMDFGTELDRLAMPLATRTTGTHAWELQFDTLVQFRRLDGMRDNAGYSLALMTIAMEYLLARPWFRRIWIIQEVASAQSGIVACRTEGRTVQIPMRTFALLPSLLGALVPPHAQVILDIMPLVGSQRKGWWNNSHDLRTLMVKFKGSESSDPLDTVYALLGISSDINVQTYIQPVYGVSVEVVFQKTLSYLLFSEIIDDIVRDLPLDRRVWLDAIDDENDLYQIGFLWALSNNHIKLAVHLLQATNTRLGPPLSGFLAGLQSTERIGSLTNWVLQWTESSTSWTVAEPASRDALEKARQGLVHLLLSPQLTPKMIEGLLLIDEAIALLLLDPTGSRSRIIDGPRVGRLATILCRFVEDNDTAAMSRFLRHRIVDFNLARDSKGRAPLCLAAMSRDTEMVNIILRNKSVTTDPTVANADGDTALHIAAKQGYDEVFRLLWQYQTNIPVDVNGEGAAGETMLGSAAIKGHVNFIRQMLLLCQPDLDINRPSGSRHLPSGSRVTPLKLAVDNGRKAVVQLLLKADRQKVDLESEADEPGSTPL